MNQKSHSNQTPDAVIFDMDGVIFDSERMVVICWKEVADRYGIPDIEAACTACLGLNREASRAKFKEKYGADFPYDDYKAQMSALFHEKCSGGRLPIKKGAENLLRELKKRQIPTAIASSTRKEIVTRELTDGGLIGYFDKIICGDMVAHSKPHPEIFLRAAKELNEAAKIPKEAEGKPSQTTITPQNTIVIEDSFHGILAANAGGFRPIMVPDRIAPTPEIEALTEIVLPSLEEVKNYLL